MGAQNIVLTSAQKAAGATELLGIDSSGNIKDTPARVAAFQASVSESGIRIVGANKTGFRPMLESLALAGQKRVDIALHSHSIGAGYAINGVPTGASTAANTELVRTQGWAANFARALSRFFDGAGLSTTEVMAGPDAGTFNSQIFTPGGGLSVPSVASGFAGASGWWLPMTSSAHTCSFTAVGQYARVYAIASSALARCRYSAPSLAAGAVQSSADVPSGTLSGGSNLFLETTIGPFTPGETVTLYGSTSGNVIPYAVDRDDRSSTPGVSVHRMCASGQSLLNVHPASNSDTVYGSISGWNTTPAKRLGCSQTLTQRFRNLAGTIIHTDVNDSGSALTLTQRGDCLTRYLDWHQSLGIPCLVIVGPMRDPSSGSFSSYTQEQLIAEYKSRAAAASNAAYIDWIGPFRGASDSATYANQVRLLTDTVHPNPVGAAMWGMMSARAVLDAMTARVG